MKNLMIKRIFASCLVLAVSFTGCKKALDINTDPNNASRDKGTPELIFPAAVASTAGSIGGEYAVLGGIWSQYWAQSVAASQFRTIDAYNINQSDFNGRFDEVFAGALNDYHFTLQKSEETAKWKYFLMATVMKAYTYQVMVDLYDQVPYTEAFQGQANLTPKWDQGADIYAGLLAEIDNALSKDYNSGPIAGNSDLVFNGDAAAIDKWVAFANTLKLKMYLRMVYANPAVAEAGIRGLFDSGVTFLTVDASLNKFVDEANKDNPLHEFTARAITAQNLRASNTFLSWLVANGDPRIRTYFGNGPTYLGIDQGDYQNTNTALIAASVNNSKPTDPVQFISLAESNLLQAEALERYYAGAGASAKYNAGVTAAFQQAGLDAAAAAPFIATGGKYAYLSTGTFEQKLEQIITQKWASFPGSHSLEGFFEKNRTGYPATSPVYSNAANYIPGQFVVSKVSFLGNNLPKRLIFPDNERKTNPNTPAIVPLTQKVWWDKKP